MSSLDSTTYTNHHPSNPPTTIIFECIYFRRDIGLLLLKRKDSKFEIHLHNDYINDVIEMVLDIKDFKKFLDSL